MSRLLDITPPISDRLWVWPGDTPPTREVLLDLANGDPITLSALRATVHLGAHADAPNHYGRDSPSIEACSLNRYLGPCQVVDVAVRRGSRIAVSDLRGPIDQPRVLFRTGTFDFQADPGPTPDFAAIDPALIEHLADHGVVLVGIDTPSVDLFDSKDLPAHHACLRRDLSILEGLALEGVPEGRYELIALPLKLVGFDASPVRAVLRTLES